MKCVGDTKVRFRMKCLKGHRKLGVVLQQRPLDTGLELRMLVALVLKLGYQDSTPVLFSLWFWENFLTSTSPGLLYGAWADTSAAVMYDVCMAGSYCGARLGLVDETKRRAWLRGEKSMHQKGRKKMGRLDFRFRGREFSQRSVSVLIGYCPFDTNWRYLGRGSLSWGVSSIILACLSSIFLLADWWSTG